MPSLVSGNSSSTANREQMRGRVAVDFERFGILGGQDLQRGVAFERPREIVQDRR